jgi:hypothetical protein
MGPVSAVFTIIIQAVFFPGILLSFIVFSQRLALLAFLACFIRHVSILTQEE